MKSAYERWNKFMFAPDESQLFFPIHEAKAIMAIRLKKGADWRRFKREVNKAARKARAQIRSTSS